MMKRLSIPGSSADVSLVVKPRAFASGTDSPGAAATRGEIKFPPLAPPRDVVIPELPNPSAYWINTPAVLGAPLADDPTQFWNRKRVMVGLTVAVALHVLLILGWWLSPPLRLKAGYAADRWVPVLSVPKASGSPMGPRPVPAGAAAATPAPSSAVEILDIPPAKAPQSP